MGKPNTAVEEIRNTKHRLIAKHYPDKGVIEIWQKGERTIIIIPAETPIRVCHGTAFSTK